jgi:lipopolysaccharide export system permease protein
LIIKRALYREAAISSLAITVVLLIVMVFMSLTFLLGRAARGETAEDVVFVLLGLQTLKKLDLLLPLGFYLGVLLTLSRWYRDSEMTVLAACGVGLMQLLRPVMVLGLIFALVVSLGAFYLSPLAARYIENVKNESAHRSEVSLITPGVFTESPGSGRIIYAEKIQDNGDLENVFVSSYETGKEGVVVAKSGHPFIDSKTGDKFIALMEGTLYDGAPGMVNYRIVVFGTLNLRIEQKKVEEAPLTVEGTPTLLLLNSGDRHLFTELHWRIAKPIALFVLSIYAMVFAYTDVRRGRLSNLFVAILVYFIYSNLLGLGQTLIRSGKVPPMLGLWWVHVGMALIAGYLLVRRAHNRPLFSFFGISRR